MPNIKKLLKTYGNSLLKEQATDGCFISLSSPDPDFTHGVLHFRTVFSNALILQCLCSTSSNPVIETIKEKLNSFLMTQKSANDTFNYWDITSKEYITIPYPDDLDDTFCAFSALHLYNPAFLSGKNLRTITELLVTQEASTGGPYYTWITGKQDDIEWKDIDLAVNSNIAYFLSHLDILLEKIVALIENAIMSSHISSRYYPSGFPVIYFIARWYKGPLQKQFIGEIEKMLKEKPHTFLDELLAATALIRCNQTQHKIVKKVVLALQKDPLIVDKPFSFYRGVNPSSDGKKYHSASRALSLTFAIEFLSLYEKTIHMGKGIKELKEEPLQKMHKKILTYAMAELNKAKDPIAQYGIERLNILNQDKDIVYITTLPYQTYLCMKKPRKLKEDIFVTLGGATLFGWLAYDIYDDFFDQHGVPVQLGAANFALRKLTDLFTHKVISENFNNFFHETMNTVDNANARETVAAAISLDQTTLHIDKALYQQALATKDLHKKSIGHMLGAIAIFSLHDIDPYSKDAEQLVRFFIHYLEARQMIDDMHDWEADLRAGRLNSASALLVITSYKKKSGQVSLDQLQELFWESVVTDLCAATTQHTSAARRLIHSLKSVENKKPFEAMSASLEQTIHQSLFQQKQATEFISS